MRTLFIFIFVAVVSLFVYNPEMDDFKAFLDQETRPAASHREHTSFPERMFNADTTTADAPPKPTGYATERNNFLLFSTYRVYIADDFHEQELGRYIGVATMFFELGSSDGVNAHAAQP